MNVPHNANDVARTLGELSKQLDEVTQQLNAADTDSVNKQEDAKLAEAQAFLTATGSMDIRKRTAIVETHEVRLAAETADCIVRGLQRSVRTLQSRIDVGRSLGAAVRAETQLAGFGGGA